MCSLTVRCSFAEHGDQSSRSVFFQDIYYKPPDDTLGMQLSDSFWNGVVGLVVRGGGCTSAAMPSCRVQQSASGSSGCLDQMSMDRWNKLYFLYLKYVCVCVCIYIYIHTHTHTYIHTYIYTYVRTCIHTRTHTRTRTHTHKHMHAHTRTHARTRAHTHTHTFHAFVTFIVILEGMSDSQNTIVLYLKDSLRLPVSNIYTYNECMECDGLIMTFLSEVETVTFATVPFDLKTKPAGTEAFIYCCRNLDYVL